MNTKKVKHYLSHEDPQLLLFSSLSIVLLVGLLTAWLGFGITTCGWVLAFMTCGVIGVIMLVSIAEGCRNFKQWQASYKKELENERIIQEEEEYLSRLRRTRCRKSYRGN